MILKSNMDLRNLDFIKDKILSHYDLEVSYIQLIKFKDSKKQRAIYKVITPYGNYCLKKVYYSKNELEFVLYLMNYLENKKMYLPKIIKTKDHKSYLDYHDHLFFLMTWINGKKCSYDDPKNLELISKNLATFHSHSIDFDYLPRSKNRYNFSNWFIDFNKKAIKLSKIRDQIYKDFSFNMANTRFLSIYHHEESMIYKSLSLLLEVDFKKILMKSVVDHTFCHLDYVNKNLYIDENKVYMIDFDRSKLDIPIHDLAGLLRRIMRRKNTKWNFETAQLIIDTYISIKPLSKDELRAILAYVIFPQKFFITTKRYMKDQKNIPYYEKQFKKIEKQYENKEIFASQFEKYYKTN